MPRPSATQAASETTPLLPPSSPVPESSLEDAETAVQSPLSPLPSSDADAKDEDTPLPKAQIFLLCLTRTVEPIAYFCIFPFINQMIWETGEMAEEDVGFYSGLIESLFSLTQMCLMIFWGRAADRIGRKPVLVFSLAGASIFTGAFGLSKRVWQMIFFRCCAGLFAGTVVTIRTMITENSTAKTQARAFGLFAFAGNVGIFLGPLIGGALSNPTEQYPIDRIFGGIKFFKEFPYALPTFTTGALALITVLCSAMFLKETLKRRDKSGAPAAPQMSAWEVARAPGVPIVLFIYSHIMLLAFSYTAVMPVFYFTPVPLGGFGFTPPQISLFMASVGVSQAIWLLVFFPLLQRRFGTVGLLRGCLTAWPFLFGFAPVCNWLLRKGWARAFWIVAPITQIGGTGVAMAFTCVQLLLNAATPPSPENPNSKTANLGTLNAIALTLTSATRAFAPGVFTSLFAIGVRSQFLHGYLVWVILCFLTGIGWIAVEYGIDDIPGEGRGRIKKHFGGVEGASEDDSLLEQEYSQRDAGSGVLNDSESEGSKSVNGNGKLKRVAAQVEGEIRSSAAS